MSHVSWLERRVSDLCNRPFMTFDNPAPVHFSELHFDQSEECVGCGRSVTEAVTPPAFIYVVVLVW